MRSEFGFGPSADNLSRWVGLIVLLVVGVACTESRVDAQQPVPGVDVRSYDATLRVEPESRRINGRLTVDVHHPDTLQRLRLQLTDLTVDTVRVDGQGVDAVHRDGQLVVPLSRSASSSDVFVAYRGIPDEGIYARSYKGQRVVFTDSWPNRARGWLPSVDHPSDPAAFRLTLVVPSGYETVANGQLVREEETDGWRKTEWVLTNSAPTYAMAFAISDFAPTHATAGDTLPVDYYLLAPDSALAGNLKRTPETLSFLARTLGPYAYDNYQVVQVPIRYGGMENAALPFIKPELFADQVRVEQTQVHEAVHQWYGNQVVLGRWRDLWLSEGVATYLTTVFYEEVQGLAAARRHWTGLVKVPSLDSQILVPDRVVDPEEFLTWVPYRKGASVLHIIRRAVGDSAFFNALRIGFREYAGRPITTPDFLQMLERTSGQDLDRLAAYWIYGDEYPVLQLQWHPNRDQLTWSIENDAGTLDDIPLLLSVRYDNQTSYVSMEKGVYTVDGDMPSMPDVRPVGVLMHVRRSSR